MKIAPNLRIFITGKTQSGKSHFCKWLLKSFPARIIYDLKREYTAFGVQVHSLATLRFAVQTGYNKIVYQPEDLSIEHFNEVCGFIFRYLRNCVFVVDEVHNFCYKSFIPMEFKRLITIAQGQPYNIGIIAISQRPANTHNDILGNASIIVAFKLHLQHDAKAISDMTGIPAEELQGLEYYHFYVYNDRDKDSIISKHQPI